MRSRRSAVQIPRICLSALADGTTVFDMMARWGFEPTLAQKLILRAKGAAKKLLRRV